jgi:hypothetical protein
LLRGIPLLCTSQVGAAERLQDGVSCLRCESKPESIATALRRFSAMEPGAQEKLRVTARAFALDTFTNAQFVAALDSLRSRPLRPAVKL